MPEKLKDIFFTKKTVTALADNIKKYYSKFDKKQFLKLVFDSHFDKLELKERMRHITICLKQFLPGSFKQAITILKKAAPHTKGFEAMCLPDYVEMYGMENWDLSFEALALFTKYSSSEFAIRPFIIENVKKTMAFMKKLARDKDKNVRRFASEGCRPRLPWAMAIPVFKKDPSPVLPVLEILKNDDSEFVRRSVANNLNDISKDNPDIVLKLCKKWSGKSESTDRIIKHACRTMLKAGDRRAMILFGFADPKEIQVTDMKFETKRIKIGENIFFSFVLMVSGNKANKVRLEYAVTYKKAKGKSSRKVFKISEKEYKPGEYSISRKQTFANMSTRKHYPGQHTIAIIVNGIEKAKKSFELVG